MEERSQALDLVDHVAGPRRGGDAIRGHWRALVPEAGEPEGCSPGRRSDEVTGDREGAVVEDLVDIRRARLEPTHRRVMRKYLGPALRIDVRAGLSRDGDPNTALWRAETKPRPEHGFGRRPRGDHLAAGIRAELQVELAWGCGPGNTRPPPESWRARARREHHPADADSTQDVSTRGALDEFHAVPTIVLPCHPKRKCIEPSQPRAPGGVNRCARPLDLASAAEHGRRGEEPRGGGGDITQRARPAHWRAAPQPAGRPGRGGHGPATRTGPAVRSMRPWRVVAGRSAVPGPASRLASDASGSGSRRSTGGSTASPPRTAPPRSSAPPRPATSG